MVDVCVLALRGRMMHAVAMVALICMHTCSGDGMIVPAAAHACWPCSVVVYRPGRA